MQNPLIVSVKLNKKDIFSWYFSLNMIAKSLKDFWLYLILVFPLGFLLITVIENLNNLYAVWCSFENIIHFIFEKPSIFISDLITYFFIKNPSFLITLFFIGILFPLAVLLIRTLSNFRSNQTLEKEITYEFSLESIKISSEFAKSELLWNSFTKAQEDKVRFLIYDISSSVRIIPKRFFKSESEMVTLRGILKEKLGKNAKLEKE